MITVNPNTPEHIRHVYKHIGKPVAGSASGFTGRVAAVERATVRGTRYNIWLDEVTGMPVPGDAIAVAPKRLSPHRCCCQRSQTGLCGRMPVTCSSQSSTSSASHMRGATRRGNLPWASSTLR